ncbi:MAG: hypothetical protein JNK38_12380 [Acidobacteria bacterium]|nr:hypothetical protein [Acidobacteriota bacterium]
METTFGLLGSTRDHSAVSITTKSISETRSGQTVLLGLVILLASLAPVCVAQSESTKDVSAPKLVLRHTHLQGMNGQSLSPDGSLLATQHQEGVIKLWDVQSTGLVRVLNAPQSLATPKAQLHGDHAFSPDGKYLVSVWSESVEAPKYALQVWDVASGTLRPVPLGGKFLRFRFTPDSQSLIAWDFTGRLASWNLLSGEIKFDQQVHNQDIDAVALSTDQQTLATCSEEAGDIKVWDLANQRLKTTIRFGVEGRKEMLFSPDGNFLAISVTDCRYPAMTKIYDTRTWKLFKLVDEYNQTIGFSADSQVFATTCVCEDLMLVNMKTGFELLTQQSRGFDRTIKLLESIPEVKLFRAGEIVRATFTDKTVEWNSATGNVTGLTDAKDFSRETEIISQRLFSLRPSNLYLSDLTNSELQVEVPRKSGSPLAVKLDWQTLQIKLVAPKTADPAEQIRIAFGSRYGLRGTHSATRFNGKLIGIFDGTGVKKEGEREVHVAKLSLEENTKDHVFGIQTQFSQDESLIATTSHTGKAAEIFAELDKLEQEMRKEQVTRSEAAKAKNVAGQPDEQKLSSDQVDLSNHPSFKAANALVEQLEALSDMDEQQTISIWDVKTGKRLQTIGGYRGWFYGGEFLNDNQALMAQHVEKSPTDKEAKLVVRFWDVRTGKLLHELKREGSFYGFGLIPFPNKEMFVTTRTKDNNIEIELRQLQTGKLQQQFVVSENATISENSFSKDGKRLLVSERGKALLFDVISGKLLSTWEGDLPYQHSYPFSPNGKLFVGYNVRNQWSGDFNTVQLRSAETGALLGQLMLFSDDPYVPPSPDGKPQLSDKPLVFDWLLYTPEGYYAGSEGVEKYFTWQIGERALPGAAYAKEFNRPDLVQKALQTK